MIRLKRRLRRLRPQRLLLKRQMKVRKRQMKVRNTVVTVRLSALLQFRSIGRRVQTRLLRPNRLLPWCCQLPHIGEA